MPSTVAWLDQDEAHQRRMREAIALFRDRGAVDELGVGRIRDAFSNRLFPGTSVLWRRARYLFFVPWNFGLLERGEGGRGTSEERAKAVQRRLAATLRTTEGDNEGVIGVTGADVKQPPDVVLWAALEDWGIRLDPARLEQTRAQAVAMSRHRRHDEDETHSFSDVWHPRVPRLVPDDYPANVTFALTNAEAELLSDLLQSPDAVPGTAAARRADSMLAVLLREPFDQKPDVPWELPLTTASSELRETLRNAGLFSDLIDGARLLYAHLVAERRKDLRLSADVDRELRAWAPVADPTRGEELREWASDLRPFWSLVRAINPRIGPYEQSFVEVWASLSLNQPELLRSNAAACRHIVDREHEAKGTTRARLAQDGSIGRDAPAVLPSRLTFRWPQAASIIGDVRGGLDAG